MNNSVKNTQFLFDKFIGILIFLNIFHQVISSMDLRGYESMLGYGNIFFQLSMLIFFRRGYLQIYIGKEAWLFEYSGLSRFDQLLFYRNFRFKNIQIIQIF